MPFKARSSLRLGTRKSPLALAQARWVARALEVEHPGLEVELVPFETRGDREKGDLAPLGGKGLFTLELEKDLLSGELDLAVHSLKDLPVTLPEGLAIAATPERADPRDALVGAPASLDELEAGSVLLTGSLRRRSQILARRPELEVEPVRGNVGTRIEKCRERGAAGLVLAAAGLERLELEEPSWQPLAPEVMVPAPGQGTLAVEVAAGGAAESYCRALEHGPTAVASIAERTLVAAFGGDCTLPLGALARRRGDGAVHLLACLATSDGRRVARAEVVRPHPIAAAEACYIELYGRGAEKILIELGIPTRG